MSAVVHSVPNDEKFAVTKHRLFFRASPSARLGQDDKLDFIFVSKKKKMLPLQMGKAEGKRHG